MKYYTNADFEAIRHALDTAGRKRRHDIRYACFRVQGELAGGNAAESEHHAIAREVEALPGFDGWEKFAVTWDISTPDPIVIVPRLWSIYQEWDQTIRRVAQPLPGVDDGK